MLYAECRFQIYKYVMFDTVNNRTARSITVIIFKYTASFSRCITDSLIEWIPYFVKFTASSQKISTLDMRVLIFFFTTASNGCTMNMK